MSPQMMCPTPGSCMQSYNSVDDLVLHLRVAHGIEGKPSTVEGMPAKDEGQSVADAQRTLSSAQGDLRRAKHRVGRFRVTMFLDAAALILFIGMLIFSGLVNDVMPALANFAGSMTGIAIPGIVVTFIIGVALFCWNVGEENVLKDRDRAEERVDRAEEQVAAVTPAAVEETPPTIGPLLDTPRRVRRRALGR